MKLETAQVCLDCDEVVDADAKQCPECSSRALYHIALWLRMGVKQNSDPKLPS